MICASCHGLVIWKGPLINLTHTECQNCGAVNNQLPDENEEEMTDTPVTDTSLEALKREVWAGMDRDASVTVRHYEGMNAAIDYLHSTGRIRLGGGE